MSGAKVGGERGGPGNRAVAYVRVSTSGQAEKGMGLQAQRQAVREFADASGFKLLDVVEEVASGGVQAGDVFAWEHRPVLLSLIDRAHRGEFDMLLVARYDRLSRDHVTLITLERMLQQHEVAVVSAGESESNGDSALAEYLRAQLALVAQLERGMIRDRLNAGKAQRRRRGQLASGLAPYGYRSAGEGRLEVDDEQATVVRRIFDQARRGVGPSAIATMLNDEGIPSPAARHARKPGSTWTSSRWGRQTVANILRSRVYFGELHNVSKAQPPIVSRRVWNAAQRE